MRKNRKTIFLQFLTFGNFCSFFSRAVLQALKNNFFFQMINSKIIILELSSTFASVKKYLKMDSPNKFNLMRHRSPIYVPFQTKWHLFDSTTFVIECKVLPLIVLFSSQNNFEIYYIAYFLLPIKILLQDCFCISQES